MTQRPRQHSQSPQSQTSTQGCAPSQSLQLPPFQSSCTVFLARVLAFSPCTSCALLIAGNLCKSPNIWILGSEQRVCVEMRLICLQILSAKRGREAARGRVVHPRSLLAPLCAPVMPGSASQWLAVQGTPPCFCHSGHPRPALPASCSGERQFLGGHKIPSRGLHLSLLPQSFSISGRWLG